jgi:hypothetical protein
LFQVGVRVHAAELLMDTAGDGDSPPVARGRAS